MERKEVEYIGMGEKVTAPTGAPARRAYGGAACRIAVPAVVSNSGDAAILKYAEFFTAQIRNRNTRTAYGLAAQQFFCWCERLGLPLEAIDALVVATYIEGLVEAGTAAPTVKLHLAALRSLFDWLVIGQIIRSNPAASVRGPKYSTKRGKTPVCEEAELRQLFATLEGASLASLRDRALLGILLYSFARISAVCRMNTEDYLAVGSRRMLLRLHEKGGKYHEVPAHHLIVEYLDAYLEKAGLRAGGGQPLFQSIRGTSLTGKRLTRQDAWAMIKRRCKEAGISLGTTCHSFRASGITIFLQNGGTIEHAALIAGHESPRTTKLYDRRSDEISQTEIERVRL